MFVCVLDIGIREMQEQLVCRGCRTTLMYPRGAINVCCALCRTINPPQGNKKTLSVFGSFVAVLLKLVNIEKEKNKIICFDEKVSFYDNIFCVGMDMANIVCGGCGTMLMYTRSATSVRCSCCQTLNLVPGKIISKAQTEFVQLT